MRLASLSILGLVALVGALSLDDIAMAVSRRGALWRVVQACLLNHKITGAAFPCIAVETPDGPERGFAVLRSPLDGNAKVIVTPTVRTDGIEAERLRGPRAPNYFQDAWASRRYATLGLANPPRDDDIALAVNSRAGRSQDQLHIHVACLQPDVKQALDRETASIGQSAWHRLDLEPGMPSYWARAIAGRDLSHINIFDLVAAGLRIRPADMGQATIVVAARPAAGETRAGFAVLARRRTSHARDQGHGEFLLDQNCDEPKVR